MKKPLAKDLYFNNSYYHVYNRGHRKTAIFRTRDDYLQYIILLERYLEVFDVVLLSYCLMPNHFHLILRLGQSKSDISRLMHRLMTGYSYYFNKKYLCVGSLCQGRFQARKVNDINDLYNLVEYVKNNPSEAGLIKKGGTYEWYLLNERALKVGPRSDLGKRKL